MSAFSRLLSIEWIKTRKRTVFWVAIVIQAVVMGVLVGGQQYMHHIDAKNAPFTLPNGWDRLIATGTQVGMLMIFVSISLLAASETQWKTQRQNVIDGLTRIEYFAGKLMVVAALALIMWLDIMIMGIVFGAMGGKGALAWPLFTPTAQNILAHALLYFIAIGTTAFMFGMLASSSGAALGLLFAFVIIEPIVQSVMSVQSGAWPIIARYLPLTVFNNLVSFSSYDQASRARLEALLTRMGRPLPLSLETSTIVTAVYILAFLSITWFAFRKRDL